MDRLRFADMELEHSFTGSIISDPLNSIRGAIPGSYLSVITMRGVELSRDALHSISEYFNYGIFNNYSSRTPTNEWINIELSRVIQDAYTPSSLAGYISKGNAAKYLKLFYRLKCRAILEEINWSSLPMDYMGRPSYMDRPRADLRVQVEFTEIFNTRFKMLVQE